MIKIEFNYETVLIEKLNLSIRYLDEIGDAVVVRLAEGVVVVVTAFVDVTYAHCRIEMRKGIVNKIPNVKEGKAKFR